MEPDPSIEATPETRRREATKRFLAVVVFTCFFLPLCQCTSKVQDVVNATRLGPSTTEQPFIPVHTLNFIDVAGALAVAVFLWPVVFVVLRKLATSRMNDVAIGLAEVVCGLASLVYVVLVIRYFGQIRYGGVIVLLAFFIHLALSAIPLIGKTERSP